jgi:hypothetical protein
MSNEDAKVAGKVARGILGRDAVLERVSDRGSCNRVFLAAAGAEKIVVRLNMDRDRSRPQPIFGWNRLLPRSGVPSPCGGALLLGSRLFPPKCLNSTARSANVNTSRLLAQPM